MKSKWDESQINLLCKVWKEFKQKDILNLFPERTWKSIQRKAECLNLKRSRVFAKQCEYIPNWIVGELLGDGSVGVEGKYAHTTKYREYAEFLKKKFE